MFAYLWMQLTIKGHIYVNFGIRVNGSFIKELPQSSCDYGCIEREHVVVIGQECPIRVSKVAFNSLV